MNKTIDDVEKELRWYAEQPAIEGKAAALAGLAMLHAVREFDTSSCRLGSRMLWLTILIGFIAIAQVAVGIWSVAYR